MMKNILLSLLLLLVSSVLAVPVLDIDFSSAEGFNDGEGIEGSQGINAQGGWYAGDTDGTGYAACTSAWNRARNFSDFTLDVGHSVVIETTLRLTDADGIFSDADNFEIGFAESAVHTGANTPSIGSSLYTFTDGSYWFGGDAPSSRISVSSVNKGDWIQFSQTITRSATADTFTGQVSASNITDGVDLGSASSWTESTADGSWNGTMRPSFRTWANTAATALEIDRWVVSTVTNLPPDLPPPSTVTNRVALAVDVTRTRSIGGVGSLDRETWFGVYHETGYARGNFTDGGVTMTYDEWINEEGRMWPSRGTVNFASMDEDPTRPSYVDPSEFSDLNGLFDYRYAWAKTVAPNHKTVLSGEGHGNYPAYMCWDPALTHSIKTVSNNLAHAEAVVNTLSQLESRNGLMPQWFEVMNESSIQNNYGWHWDSDAWDKLSEFHATVADAVHNSVYSNVVKVAGPTDAYPFRDDKDGDFSQWAGSNKKFIQLAGDRMDAYAIHTYEQMTTNSMENSSFDDQFSVPEIWHQGRLASFIDLWENEHDLIHGGTLPFVFSEYGLLRNRNPDGDRNAYYQVRSCNGILLSLLDRPDVVDKMSAFLMSQAPYNWNQKRVFFASDDGGTTRYKTSYFDYLRFWRDLEGDYLFSSIDTQHVAQHAFLSGGSNLLLVLKNNYNQPFVIDVQTSLPAGATLASAEVQRIYYNGVDNVALDAYRAVPDLGSVVIDPDETIMLKIALSGMPELSVWDESNHYGNRTLVPMQSGVGEVFSVELPSESNQTHSAGRLNLGLYAFSGFSAPLQEVSVNGTVLSEVPDISFTAGATRSWKQISIRIPEGILVDGVNAISVVPAEGDALMKITSVRLTAESASDAVLNSDRDRDGMTDAWEIANNLNPADATDGAMDSDLDGYDNTSEYICNTDPHDENSFLLPQGFPMVGTGYKVSFDSKSNRLYAVEATADLLDPWADFTNGIPGNGTLIEIVDTAGFTNRFYRVRVEAE